MKDQEEISKIKIVSDQEKDKPLTRDTLEIPSEKEAEFIAKAAHTM